MKKNVILSFMLMLMLLLVAACGTSGSESENGSGGGNENGSESANETESGSDSEGSVEEKATYTVATDSNFVPFEFLNEETGEMDGFDIELMRALAEEAGFEVEFETLEFDGLIAGMQTGKFPIGIAGITITEDRQKTIDFSDPYYDAGIIVVVQADNNEIKSIEDLKGKEVATRTGSTTYDYLTENYPEIEVVPFPGIVEAYMEVRAGRVDAVVYDSPNAQYYVSKEADGNLKTVGDVLEAQQYGIAFEKGSELVDDVNKALAKFKEDGTYDDIYEKWFGDRPYGTE
jgi:glutamine transport system substrate-binding protein